MPRSQDKNIKPADNSSGEWGFTLVEVLTVAAIVGILTTMAVVSMRGGRRIAFETKAIAAMKNIAENEVIYYQRYMEYGNWNQLVGEGDLVDPGYAKVDDLTESRDTPIANLYSIDLRLSPISQCFTAIAFPQEASIWHLRTYAVTCDGSILNSHDNGRFFSTLIFLP